MSPPTTGDAGRSTTHHFPPSPSEGPAAPSSCRSSGISGVRSATRCHDPSRPVPFSPMRVLIMGCGRVGSELSHALGEAGHDVTVIDKRAEAFDRYPPGDHARRIVGLGFDRDVLEEAGIREADAFIAVSSGDNSNIVSARVALEHYHVPKVIARIFDPRRAEIYERLNIPTVATTTWGVKQMQLMLLHTGKEVRESFGGGSSCACASRCRPTWWASRCCRSTSTGHILDRRRVARREGIRPGGRLHDAGGRLPDRHDREGLHGRARRIARSAGGASLMKVLVTGGGAIGRHVAADLVARGHEVTLIEQDRADRRRPAAGDPRGDRHARRRLRAVGAGRCRSGPRRCGRRRDRRRRGQPRDGAAREAGVRGARACWPG